MIALLWWCAETTLMTAVMIFFTVATCRLFRHRPAVQHALWVVVLVKFVTPPIVSWPWSAQQVVESLWSQVASNTQTPLEPRNTASAEVLSFTTSGSAVRDPSKYWHESLTALTAERSAFAGRSASDAASREGLVRVASGIVLGLWLAGTVTCAVRLVRRIASHTSIVRGGAKAPKQLVAEVACIADQVGLQPPQAVVAREITSPFVWFLGRLRLVWPEALLGDEEIIRSRGVIAHELAHVRRGDHWVAWLELAAGLIWWWNPLFRFVRARLRASAEMACDAVALSTCPENRRAYAELLLQLSVGPKTGALALALGVSASAPSSFERRLSMILSDRVSGNMSACGFIAAGVLALMALPGWSTAQQSAPRRETPSGASGLQAPAESLRSEPSQDPLIADAQASTSTRETSTQSEAIAGRLERLEAEIQRLAKLLEQSRQPGSSEPTTIERLPQAAALRDYVSRSSARPSAPTDIVGQGRSYILTSKDQRAYLTALSDEGKQIWVSQFPAPQPFRGVGVSWTLEAANDDTKVVLTWTRSDERLRFSFDANTGQVNPEPPANTEGVNTNLTRAFLLFSGDGKKSLELDRYETRRPLGGTRPRGRTEPADTRLRALERAIEDLDKRLQEAPSPGRR
jgi:beta-lactamase regulating signal transducer with metallopeptidase domain